MRKNHWLEDYQRIEKAILFIDRNFHHQPGLEEVAKEIELSEFHFQRLFKRWAGISPKRFLQAVTLEYAKKLMNDRKNLLDITLDSGLSSTGRLHDLFINIESMTPGDYQKNGRDLEIYYGYHPTPFGECLIAVTDKGICHLGFLKNGNKIKALSDLKRKWKSAQWFEKPSVTSPYIQRIFNHGNGKKKLNLHLKGTNFQIKVWQALLNIPKGSVASYENIAKYIHKPKAVRAVANAVAHNPIAYLIPCHRVLRKTGAIGGYHWGIERKKAILSWEFGKD